MKCANSATFSHRTTGKPSRKTRRMSTRTTATITTLDNQRKIVDASVGGDTGFDPRYVINTAPDASIGPPVADSRGNVLGGNGRTMTLQRVFESNPAGAAEYRALLDRNAHHFGIDPASYAHMKATRTCARARRRGNRRRRRRPARRNRLQQSRNRGAHAGRARDRGRARRLAEDARRYRRAHRARRQRRDARTRCSTRAATASTSCKTSSMTA